MFTLPHRRYRQTIQHIIDHEQQMLDAERYANADHQQMQLHLDRMQIALDKMLTVN